MEASGGRLSATRVVGEDRDVAADSFEHPTAIVKTREMINSRRIRIRYTDRE